MGQLKTPWAPIVLVDDERPILVCSEAALRYAGFDNIVTCSDAREVAGILDEHGAAALVLDLTMPHLSGEEVLASTTQEHPEVPVLIVTGANDVGTAVACMRSGAFDYLVKPVEDTRLVSAVRRAVEIGELRRENSQLRTQMHAEGLQHPQLFSEIVTRNATMKSICRYVETVAITAWPVLITGETGTGKELFARAVHALSKRKGEFVSVNVSGVDDLLLSDTLFGHIKGAYTGAETARPGLIEKAAGGTLFLDEIGELSQVSQVKLLRLLQEREYFQLGADHAKRTDARIVVATNRDLEKLQGDRQFRKDLYYRLRTHHVHIPPLRERTDDIPLLLDHFITKAATLLGKSRPSVPKELSVLLGTYAFPGNVRELESMVYEAVANHQSHVMSLELFRNRIESRPAVFKGDEPVPPLSVQASFPTLREATNFIVKEALRRAEGNHTIAAQLLGISRPALVKRLHKLEGAEED